MQLKPEKGFDWVTWGRPDAIVSPLCSYCSASFKEDDMPLIIWSKDGHAAKFCDECQVRWWGLTAGGERDA
jgi:hypothetical protein